MTLLYWWIVLHGAVIKQEVRRARPGVFMAVVQIVLVALMVASEAPERLHLVAVYNVGAWAIILTGYGLLRLIAVMISLSRAEHVRGG